MPKLIALVVIALTACACATAGQPLEREPVTCGELRAAQVVLPDDLGPDRLYCLVEVDAGLTLPTWMQRGPAGPVVERTPGELGVYGRRGGRPELAPDAACEWVPIDVAICGWF